MKRRDLLQHLRKSPEIVYRDGKPTAVIIDINEYQEMLERLEGAGYRPDREGKPIDTGEPW
jgi:hypothetical protein